MKKEEAHIIKEILSGKTEHYEYFLDCYGQQVFVLVDRIVSCQEEAEELTQDVFIKAFQQLSSFKAESSFSTWIYRIATNECIRFLNRKKEETVSTEEMQAELMNKLMASEYVDYDDEDHESIWFLVRYEH